MLVTERRPQPRIELTPLRVDLGTVRVDEVTQWKFTLRNTGSAQLLISEIKTGCQCVVPELVTRVLAPGVSTPLLVGFKPTSTGLKRQQVVVKTNDPMRPAFILTLQAMVVATTQPVDRDTKDLKVTD